MPSLLMTMPLPAAWLPSSSVVWMFTIAGLAESAMPSTSIDPDALPDEELREDELPDEPDSPKVESAGRNGEVSAVAVDEAVPPPQAVSAARPSAAEPHTTTTAATNSASHRAGEGRAGDGPAGVGWAGGADRGDSSYDMAPSVTDGPVCRLGAP